MTGPGVGPVEGRRLVLALYGLVVALGAAVGYALGSVGADGLDPRLFGVVDLPATPIGLATYGALTIGVALGAVLGLVVVVSKRDPDG